MQALHDGNVFDAKTDKASADLYFHYYGMLQHQQNMLQVSEDILLAIVICSEAWAYISPSWLEVGSGSHKSSNAVIWGGSIRDYNP